MTVFGSARPNETLRQVVHVAFGFVALSLRYLSPLEAVLLLLAALAHNLFLIPRYARALWRAEDEARGFSIGIVLYPAVVLGFVLLFLDRPPLAAAAWGILAFGDGFATLVGRTVGGPRLPWNSRKTWAGTIAYVVFGSMAAAGLLAFVSLRPDQGAAISFVGALGLCAVAAVAGAVVESLPLKLDDNLTTSIVVAATLAAGAAIVPAELVAAVPALASRALPAATVVAGLAWLAWRGRAVDRSGAVGGFVLAVAIWVTGGWEAFTVFGAFFVLGSSATRIGGSTKEAAGVAQEAGGRRGFSHAFANTGLGAGLSFLSVATGRPELFRLAFTGAMATAAFDTVSTEIGKAWGRHPVLVTTGRPVSIGTVGAVSGAGTGAGLLAALLVAGLGAGLGLYGTGWIVAVVVAAALGAMLESVAGATLGRRGLLGHGTLNFLNTAIGAGICLAIGAWFGL